MTKQEIWKDIPEWEGLYQASTLGRIRSLDRTYIDSIGRCTTRKGRIRIPHINASGYYYTLMVEKERRLAKTYHRLVALTFIPNQQNKCCVNHKDGDKLNNRLDNLEWVTVRENSAHWIENSTTMSSNFPGVTLDKQTGLWAANIFLEDSNYYLGKYVNESEAKIAYDTALKDWEEKYIIPHYRNPTYSSKYKCVYYNEINKNWYYQIREGGKSFSHGGFISEDMAHDTYIKTLEEYRTTSIFPVKKYASIYKGVNWKESISKWQASPCINGKKKYIGVFSNEEDAAKAIQEFLGLNELPLRKCK